MRAEVDRGRCDKEQNPHDASVSLHTFPNIIARCTFEENG
jgi:hypothetical protein